MLIMPPTPMRVASAGVSHKRNIRANVGEFLRVDGLPVEDWRFVVAHPVINRTKATVMDIAAV
jgi:hypothetical protein